jgi:hypothetical protein
MANYMITGRNSSAESLVSVQISAIQQDSQVVQDMDIVNAVRAQLAGTAGVASVVAQKFEQVITII